MSFASPETVHETNSEKYKNMKSRGQLQQENEILIECLRRCYIHTAAMQMKGYSVAERRDLAASVHGSIRRTLNQLGIELNP